MFVKSPRSTGITCPVSKYFTFFIEPLTKNAIVTIDIDELTCAGNLKRFRSSTFDLVYTQGTQHLMQKINQLVDSKKAGNLCLWEY